nr:DEAD/DEAH box helicase family protein [Eubacterium sp.]
VFLIDRKDLDMQTTMAFQSYADNDIVDVDNTDNVDDLIKKLSDGNQQMIVTTRQKLQTMINKKLKEGTKQYDKIRSVRVAFVVDECHRAVTPQTKRDIDGFFNNPLWYGFTGTPIFEENKYDQLGDLPQTTEQMYGECLHSYTIKEAIHDEAVLGFMVENLGVKDLKEDQKNEYYDSKKHMRNVLDSILNHSFSKLGMQNGKGRTYEAILTVKSIAKAQEYYELLKDVKEGKDVLKISEEVTQALPDFPKFAITYSLSENEESSIVNQDKMKKSLDDYNNMFGTHYGLDGIGAYNANLNERLARKETKYLDREQQLDLVIVVNRLLTGFDAPCLSTLFIDRQPMSPQDLIQAFSRTNRLFDANKQYGQIVTFQSPVEFKDEINRAIMLYSRGGTGEPIAEDWEDVLDKFKIDLNAMRGLAETPDVVSSLSRQQKKTFIQLFRSLDRDFAHLKAFSVYDPIVIERLGFSEELYEDYAAAYKNVVKELQDDSPKPGGDDDSTTLVTDDYELIAFSKIRIDFEYIVLLLQGIVETLNPEHDDFNEVEFDLRIKRIREIVDEFSNENPKLSALLIGIIDDIEKDKEKYIGQDVSVIINQMRYEVVDKEIRKFAEKWFLDFEDVKYEVYNFRNGEMANATLLKDKADYAAYKESVKEPLKKFKFNSTMIDEFKEVLMPEVGPLL